MLNYCEHCGAALDPGEKCSCTDTGLALRCIQAPVISEDLEGVRRQLDLVLQELAQLELSAEAQRLVLQREPGQVQLELQELESQQGAQAGS